jgi:hypothetical protein
LPAATASVKVVLPSTDFDTHRDSDSIDAGVSAYPGQRSRIRPNRARQASRTASADSMLER